LAACDADGCITSWPDGNDTTDRHSRDILMADDNLEESVSAHLFSLASGSIGPEAASEWALRIMDSDAPELRDERVWTALDRLSGADLMAGPGQYLHGKEDFGSWASEFDGGE
jgi:hypothetical protein